MERTKLSWDEHTKLFFTIKGRDGLTNRMKNFIHLLISTPQKNYPLSFFMFDFPKLNIQSRIELRNRIKELMDILNIEEFDYDCNGKNIIPIKKSDLDGLGGESKSQMIA